jgi:hypothetical protein
MEQVSKELMAKIVEMLPRIKDKQAQFTEEELVPIKAFFEKITGVSIGNMMNCGGKLCEDVRRSISNYMASYKHVKTEAPKKEAKKLEPKKEATPAKESGDNRAELMAEALKIAEAKGIKKPHHKSGTDKLKAYINENS